jgi:hypothetical protein
MVATMGTRVGDMGKSSTSQRGYRLALLMALAALTAVLLAVSPSGASAAPCPVNPGNATSWIGGSGSFNQDSNWSNGGPTGSCDVSITAGGNYTVSMTAGANMKSLTLGGPGSTPQLVISDQSPNTILSATVTGITIAAGSAITLTCEPQPTGCLGGSSGGSQINAGSSDIVNNGTIRVDANSGTGARLTGNIDNLGLMDFDQSATHSGGTLDNKSDLAISDTKVLRSTTSHCGDSTGTVFVNDAGGTLTTEGSGTLDAVNYEQGDGDTFGANPVQKPCGSLKYTGDGTSKVRAYGGFNLFGDISDGQELTVSSESANTIVSLQTDVTNSGKITLTCPGSGCSGGEGGGAGFNVAGRQFTNAGTFAVDANSGTGAGIGAGSGGQITNTGTMNFDQSAGLGGQVVNQGAINLADGKTATSSGSSCGDTGSAVKNDTGGSINATGTGRLSVYNYEQGAGTTSGSRPVYMPCGALKYTGSGASVIQVGGVSMTGDISVGQTLRLGSVSTGPFTNAGTIVLDQTDGNPSLNTSKVTNTGRIEVSGPSANTASVGGEIDQTGTSAAVVVPAGTRLSAGSPILLKAGTLGGGGTVQGSVENSGGKVLPGASPGTLAVTGNYTQGAAGQLAIEIAGTGAGQFDQLAVGGDATLAGTLSLIPSAGYVDSSAIGDSVDFLTYGGTGTGSFGTTAVNPGLGCPKVFAVAQDATGKTFRASVVDGGEAAACPVPPPPPPVPNTKIKGHPKARIKTGKKKVKVKFSFKSDVAGARFQCKLDKKAYTSCKSPKTYTVKPGKHRFAVRAVAAGGTDRTAATFNFKVIKKKKRKHR